MGAPVRAVSGTELLDFAIGFAQALQAFHERGIVPGRLEPDAVIRTASGSTKLVDFRAVTGSSSDDPSQ